MKQFKYLFLTCFFILLACKKTEEKTSLQKTFTIYTIGDSTMANKPNPEENPERGWGQMLPQFLNENVKIENHAVNGRSSKSFRSLGHWEKVHEKLKKDDYVFIQFGHNDSKIKDSIRFTNPHTAYRQNLIRYVQEVRAKGAIPILFTSITRRNFNENGVLVDTHGDYTLETRLVAQEFEVPLIDLQYYTEVLEGSYGVENSKKLHLHFQPDENQYFPEGIEDNTHLSVLGATEIAKIVSEKIKLLNLELSAGVIEK